MDYGNVGELGSTKGPLEIKSHKIKIKRVWWLDLDGILNLPSTPKDFVSTKHLNIIGVLCNLMYYDHLYLCVCVNVSI